jgi:hypothetical protein
VKGVPQELFTPKIIFILKGYKNVSTPFNLKTTELKFLLNMLEEY